MRRRSALAFVDQGIAFRQPDPGQRQPGEVVGLQRREAPIMPAAIVDVLPEKPLDDVVIEQARSRD